MPTFKLEEMDGDVPYGGDNDMYFRQWRLPSMKPVLDEKLDRDFQDAVAKKEQMIQEKLERRKKHSQKYDQKFHELVKKMKEASLKEEKVKKENIKFLREPTELELKSARDNLEKEFASPSSTARMVPFEGRLRPRQNPIFGEKMAGLKSLVLPPTTSAKSSVSTPKDPSFGAHETVFYPQTHDSFNLDHYNGSRPSFAFSGNNGATSTPVAKNNHFFAGGIQEEEGDDSVFENSKYVTAMESPIQPPQQMKKAIDAQKSQEAAEKERLHRENQARKAAEEAEKAEKVRLAQEKQKKEEEQKRLETARINQGEPKNVAPPISQNPNRFGRALEKSPENAGLASIFGQKTTSIEPSIEQKPTTSTGSSSLFSQKSALSSTETDSRPLLSTGFSSLFGQKSGGTSAAIPTATSLFGQKPAQSSTETDLRPPITTGSSLFGQKPGGTSTAIPTTSSLFGQRPAQSSTETDSKSPINTGSSLFGQRVTPAAIPTVSSLFGQKPVTDTKPATSTGFSSSLFGQKQNETEPKSAEKTAGFSSLFGSKLTQNSTATDTKSPINTGVSSLFGQVEKPSGTSTASPKFSFMAPTTSSVNSVPSSSASKTEVKNPVKPETPETTPPPEAQKTILRSYVLFKNYIALKKTLIEQKLAFEKSSDPNFRALMKRTITEKVTVFTQRQTESEARNEILEFFKLLLTKKEVEGFAIVGEAPRLTLATDEDVNYAVYCIVEKYISLTELDEDLAQTISDLISRLSVVVRRVEKVFIVLMFNKSTLLRQNPDECLEKFVQITDAVDDDERAHRKAQEWSQEQALVILFFTVFTKNALFHSKGRKMVLSDELLWKYVETTLAHVLEVPKSPYLILQLITICKPRLHIDRDRWDDMLETIKTVIIPELEEESFLGDEGVVSRLKLMLDVLQEA
ncbi:unnamed protein product [Caenorhabditis brenneri]